MNQNEHQILTAVAAQRDVSASRVECARTEIATTSTVSNVSSEALGRLVERLAVAEGHLDVWARLHIIATHVLDDGTVNLTIDLLQERVLDLVSQGANDTYSGRSNDLKRARYDGVLGAVQDLRWLHR